MNNGDNGIFWLFIYVNSSAVNNAIEDPNMDIKAPIVKRSKNLFFIPYVSFVDIKKSDTR
jgi:hypothetical protein